jgi:hypothetical protein
MEFYRQRSARAILYLNYGADFDRARKIAQKEKVGLAYASPTRFPHCAD